VNNAGEIRRLFQLATEAAERPGAPEYVREQARKVLEAIPGDLRESISSLARMSSKELQSDRGQVLFNLSNAVAVLESDRSVQDLFWWDDFLGRIMRPPDPGTSGPAQEWTDQDDLQLTLWMQRWAELRRISRETVSQAVTIVACEPKRRRHCVRDWLDSLAWDGTPRLDRLLTDYFGVADTCYATSAGKNWLIAMVARIYRPGCQVDNMIVFEGKQGIKKSSALRVLAGDWYSDMHESAASKEFFGVLAGKWLIEISEMDAFSKSEVTRVKQVISATVDRYREWYGRRATDHPRQCVFVGTTNRDDWNRDETGARRFWPVRCNSAIDVMRLATDREQLFAEAVERYRKGESWWNMPAEETGREQEARYVEDPWEETILGWLEGRDLTTTTEVLKEALQCDISRIGRSEQMRVAAILRRAGWTRSQRRRGGRAPAKVWCPPQVGTELR
jgi:putative DNA primase/helicase